MLSARVIVALYRGSSAISRLIRWQTRSEYSHAALLFDDNFFVESREFIGVRGLVGLQRSKGETVDLFTVENLLPDQVEAIRTFALQQLGKAYDYTMVARFVSRRQASRATAEKWFCSELVFAAFAHAGVHLLRATEPWEVSPGLLARAPALRPFRREIFSSVKKSPPA